MVVVAGVPGAGKSTLIRRAVDRTAAAVVDTDDERQRPGGTPAVRPPLRPHRGRRAGRATGRRPLARHARDRLAARSRSGPACAAGRPICSSSTHSCAAPRPASAGAAGRSRGRMDREWARWRRLRGRGVAGEGWTRRVMSRPRRRVAAWSGIGPSAYNGRRHTPRGRQASTWSVRGGGCEPRYRRPRKTPVTNTSADVSRVRARCLAQTSQRVFGPGACAGIMPSQLAGSMPPERLPEPPGGTSRSGWPFRNLAGDSERRARSRAPDTLVDAIFHAIADAGSIPAVSTSRRPGSRRAFVVPGPIG